jgi:hypothetical protein
VRPTWQVRPALPGVAAPAPWHTSSPSHASLAGITWMNKIDQGNVGSIEWMNLGSLRSMGPLVRLINCHNRHSKAILSIPKRRRFIPQHRGGPAAPPNRRADRNRHKLPTFNHLRSKDQERPSREAVDHRVDHTPSSSRTYENWPTCSNDLTFL